VPLLLEPGTQTASFDAGAKWGAGYWPQAEAVGVMGFYPPDHYQHNQ